MHRTQLKKRRKEKRKRSGKRSDLFVFSSFFLSIASVASIARDSAALASNDAVQDFRGGVDLDQFCSGFLS
jgi:hypothetical protein